MNMGVWMFKLTNKDISKIAVGLTVFESNMRDIADKNTSLERTTFFKKIADETGVLRSNLEELEETGFVFEIKKIEVFEDEKRD